MHEESGHLKRPARRHTGFIEHRHTGFIENLIDFDSLLDLRYVVSLFEERLFFSVDTERRDSG